MIDSHPNRRDFYSVTQPIKSNSAVFCILEILGPFKNSFAAWGIRASVSAVVERSIDKISKAHLFSVSAMPAQGPRVKGECHAP